MNQTTTSSSSSSSSLSISKKQSRHRRSLTPPSLCGGGTTPAECCGGTTASCAALCLCGPIIIVNLVILAVYKAPRGLFRCIRRRRLTNKKHSESEDCEKKLSKIGSSRFAVHPENDDDDDDLDKVEIVMDLSSEVEELEKEMWNRFCGGGFWRSPSEPETTSSS